MPSNRSHHLPLLLALIIAVAMMVVAPTQADAQRHPRRSARVVIVGGYGYSPYWYYYPWFHGRYWGPYGYPYQYGVYDRSASLRVDAEPREAQVFVDGYYAGEVDDFDGIFQRLRVEPGGRTITLFLEGYRTEVQDLYLAPGSDRRIRLTMQPLGPGEQSIPPAPAPEVAEADGGRFVEPPPADNRLAPDSEARPVSARFGTLALRIQPGGATVYVDGELWDGVADAGLFSIELTEGRHRIEVRSSGRATYTEDVLIRRNRTLTLNVSLTEG